MPEYIKVASTDEVEPGQGKLVEVQGKGIALFNVDEKYYAIDNTCTHRGGATVRRHGSRRRGHMPIARGQVQGYEW